MSAPAGGAASIAHWLWEDASVFRQRRERDAAALVALAGALRRGVAGVESGEFVALYDFVAGLEPAAFTRVVADPYTHFWIRIAFELAQAVQRGLPLPRCAAALARDLGCDAPAALLRLHLDEWKRIALGAALVADRKLELATPLVSQRSVALPGANAAVETAGTPLALAGVADGRVRDAAGRALPLARCAVARCGDVALPLQAHGYSVPGMGWRAPASLSDLAFQAARCELVERGLALVARHSPATFAQIPPMLRWMALNPIVEEYGENFAGYSELPGAIAVLAIENPYVIASATVHELHHNRLFCLEELGPLLDGADLGTNDEAVFFSPWREDPRPLRGILHGAYVYVPEGRFWLDVLRRTSDANAIHRLARDRCARVPLQLELALGQLERHARFTPRGEATFARIAGDARSLAAEMRALVDPARARATYIQPDGSLDDYPGSPDGTPLTSLRFVASYVASFDRDGQIPPETRAELGLG